MIGVPKTLKTKEDYQNFHKLALAGKLEFKKFLKHRYQALLDTQTVWKFQAVLADGDPGIEDSTHKVVEVKKDESSAVERHQYVLEADPGCEMSRLGFTEAEVKDCLTEVNSKE